MLGISIWPLNRLRTLLSIPLGLRQFFYNDTNVQVLITNPTLKQTSSRLLTRQVRAAWCCREAYRNLHISVRLVANELLGSLFDNLGLREGSEGCHGDWEQKNKTGVIINTLQLQGKHMFGVWPKSTTDRATWVGRLWLTSSQKIEKCLGLLWLIFLDTLDVTMPDSIDLSLSLHLTRRTSTTLAQACSQCLASWSHANRIQTTATECGENYRQHQKRGTNRTTVFPRLRSCPFNSLYKIYM